MIENIGGLCSLIVDVLSLCYSCAILSTHSPYNIFDIIYNCISKWCGTYYTIYMYVVRNVPVE